MLATDTVDSIMDSLYVRWLVTQLLGLPAFELLLRQRRCDPIELRKM